MNTLAGVFRQHLFAGSGAIPKKPPPFSRLPLELAVLRICARSGIPNFTTNPYCPSQYECEYSHPANCYLSLFAATAASLFVSRKKENSTVDCAQTNPDESSLVPTGKKKGRNNGGQVMPELDLDDPSDRAFHLVNPFFSLLSKTSVKSKSICHLQKYCSSPPTYSPYTMASLPSNLFSRLLLETSQYGRLFNSPTTLSVNLRSTVESGVMKSEKRCRWRR